MLIREAVLEDHANLMALYDAFMEVERYSKLNSDSLQAVIASKDNFILVAEEDHKLAGFITASARLVVRYPQPIMQVDELYVDPDFREHGLGRQLIQGIESIAAEHDYHRVYIESGFQYEGAHKFYQKNGYEKDGYYFKKVL
ncbi:MAG TPA: GNAT family N-acetyltransferase [Candidatus Dormibacteraeota bacterium]|nr:GNAT family N-acetyltransferase [Candidatus Dormibacteraeota bacterium]